MPDTESGLEYAIFAVFMDKLNTQYTYFEMNMGDYIKARMATGMTRGQVLLSLKSELAGGTGVFKDLLNSVNHELDFGLNGSYQIASNEGVGETVVWTLNPGAEHCDSCRHQASLGPRKMSEIPFPGFQPHEGKTNCERYCKCTLEEAK